MKRSPNWLERSATGLTAFLLMLRRCVRWLVRPEPLGADDL
jgi:hypothetical protein